MTKSPEVIAMEYCLHFKNFNSIEKLVFKFCLALAGLKFNEYSESENCGNRNCIHINSPGIPGFKFFKNLENLINDSQATVFYGDHTVFCLKPVPRFRKLTPPVWSPERFLHTNFLGPVLLVRNDASSKSFEFEELELFKFLNSHKIQKINASAMRTWNSKLSSHVKNHLNSTQQYLEIHRSKSEVQLLDSGDVLIKNFEYAPELISIVIPTRGTLSSQPGKSLIYELIKSFGSQVLYDSKIEFVIVYDLDNSQVYLDEIKKDFNEYKFKFIPYEPPFNFSRKCNVGAEAASGDVIIFLNDDTKLISKDAIVELAGTASLPGVGAVGAKLYFSNDSIQHAGIFVLGNNVGHAYFKQHKELGPFGDLVVTHEVSGVTGACFAQKKEVWQNSGGWNEQFASSYNDVEYGFRLREEGLRLLVKNDVELYHFESLTRDPTYSPEAKKLLDELWQKYLVDDLYFPEYVKTQRAKNSIKRIIKGAIRKLKS